MSDGLTLKIVGNEALIKGLDGAAKKITHAAYNELMIAAYGCLTDAQDACPVDRGDLRDSGEVIEYPESALLAEVQFTGDDERDYALFVELGHHTKDGSFVPAQPFLGPAFQDHAQQLEDNIKNI